jgi:phenylacetate-CoA ligase
MKEATNEFKKIQTISDANYEDYINLKRKEIVDYHLKNNKSYQEFVGKSEINPETSGWNELPIMTKKEFQKPLSERLSKDFTLKNVYVNKTSGSSGDPFIFAKDKFCHALTWANIINRFGWFKINFNISNNKNNKGGYLYFKKIIFFSSK